jgi:hypothetical protein
VTVATASDDTKGIGISPGVIVEAGGEGGAAGMGISPANADAATKTTNTTAMQSCWRFFIVCLLKERVIAAGNCETPGPAGSPKIDLEGCILASPDK